MTSSTTSCHHLADQLADIVDGDRAAIDNNADHLATCDDCRDARHDAQHLVSLVAHAGADHVPDADLESRVLAAVDRDTAAGAIERVTARGIAVASPPTAGPDVSRQAIPEPPRVRVEVPLRRRNRMWLAAGITAAAAAGVVGVAAWRATRSGDSGGSSDIATTGSPTRLVAIERAAADHREGVSVRAADGTWQVIGENAEIPAGATVRTDERTRASLAMADGSRLILDHRTELATMPSEIQLVSGRVVTDGTATIKLPAGTIAASGARFATTVADATTSIQVVRGSVEVTAGTGHDTVRAGEEGTIDHGVLSVASVPNLAKTVAWSELGKPPTADDAPAGLGALRAYKPGESRDRDWKLALASHDVKVRIVGPVARTEITETFRNDSPTQLEGVYQFPLPPDAKIDGLALDNQKDGRFVDGAFVDKERAGKIFRGVIERATPHVQRKPNDDIIWVQGPWKDPALLDWKRGGRFELHIFPIPAHGARTIKLAYTQVVTPHGPWRQYVYPLPHSSDGSTVADSMSIDVEVRGAAPGLVHASGYDFAADPARTTVAGLTFKQAAFVPKGDIAVDYRPADDAELRAWTFAGGAALAPDDNHAGRRGVGIDQNVVAAQRAVAADVRPTAVVALQPRLPRWREDKPRDYAIVIDASQSMVGERYTRASQLAVAMLGEMDRRDRAVVMTCDSECRASGDLHAPSSQLATDVRSWLSGQTPAGASDVVESVRAGAKLLSGDRERWVIYVGDGFASTGFRRAGDVEAAIAMSTAAAGIHVSTIGIGGDADDIVMSAVARAGGGSSLAWRPGESVGTTAVAGLESTYGTSLRDATIALPAGLADVAPTVVPTIRSGEEVLIGARVTGDVAGDVVLRGTVGGQPFEQRYPLKLAVSSASGNTFVAPLWASLAIEQLERAGRGDDRAREVALSQAFGVMSRETSLLVLESAAMFDAYGIDRPTQRATWTGEEKIDEVASSGSMPLADEAKAKDIAPSKKASKLDREPADAASRADDAKRNPFATKAPQADPPPAVPMAQRTLSVGHGRSATGRPMIPMRRVWERVPSVTPYDRVNAAITKAITDADTELTAHPDSRESHRALVQALSYAGDIDRAKTVAARWLERDRLDPQALGYEADLLGRDGQRELGLRTLAGLVDLDADRVALHERMVGAYERVGRLAQACGHRIAIASLQPKDAKSAAGALRCLRSLGRDRDAEIVRRSLPDDAARTDAEKAATAAAAPARATGELVVDAHWDGGADLDISLVTPDGTRVSWMGGRADAIVGDATSTAHEQLALRNAKRGNYLVEITRGTPSTGTARGSLDVTLLGMHRSLPFELTGARTVVGRISISLQSHLEPVTAMDPY